jgi:Fe-S cluster biogenesis protein NfuA
MTGGSPEVAGEMTGPVQEESPLSPEAMTERMASLDAVIALMKPALQADGGDLELVSANVLTGVVEVLLKGACGSCSISSSTLQDGVARVLKGRLPWVTEVKGEVDESLSYAESSSLGRGAWRPKA